MRHGSRSAVAATSNSQQAVNRVIRRLVAEHGQRAGWPSSRIVSDGVLAKDTDTSARGAAVRAINGWSCAFRGCAVLNSAGSAGTVQCVASEKQDMMTIQHRHTPVVRVWVGCLGRPHAWRQFVIREEQRERKRARLRPVHHGQRNRRASPFACNASARARVINEND